MSLNRQRIAPARGLKPLVAPALAFLLAALAGGVLVACGGSGAGLIPAANAGPLQSDFEAVAQAAQAGNGNCSATESALGKAQQDFLALPANIDAGLRRRLDEGIANLRKQAMAMCAQPAPTATTTTPATTTTATTPTTTATTTTPTTTTGTTSTPTTPATPENGGGTPAPGEGEAEEGPGKGKGKGESEGNNGSGGASAGAESAGGGK